MALYIQAAQQGKLEQKPTPAPTLTKEQVINYIKASMEMFADQDAEKKRHELTGNVLEDQNEASLTMAKFMENECKMKDKIFVKTGVEPEELEENLMHFMADPDVLMLMA